MAKVPKRDSQLNFQSAKSRAEQLPQAQSKRPAGPMQQRVRVCWGEFGAHKADADPEGHRLVGRRLGQEPFRRVERLDIRELMGRVEGRVDGAAVGFVGGAACSTAWHSCEGAAQLCPVHVLWGIPIPRSKYSFQCERD